MLRKFGLKNFVLMLTSLMLAACSFNMLPEPDFFERDVLDNFEIVQDLVYHDDIAGLSEIGVPELTEIADFEASLGKLLDASGDPRDGQMVLAENRKTDRSKEAKKVFYAAFEYKNETKFEVLQITLQEVDGQCCFLRHIQFNQDDFQRSTYHDFGTQKLSFKRLLFLALMISTVAFILFTIILIIRDKHQKRKWLWILFILVGTYGATLNWTTAEILPNFFSLREGGGFNFSLVTFNLLGGGFTRAGLFQPWIFEWGLPLGAIIYLIKRRFRSPHTVHELSENN